MLRRSLCVAAAPFVAGFSVAPPVARRSLRAFSAAAEAPNFDISAMDIRVGSITKAWHHPDSEKLFIEEIDVGDEEPLQVVSGLAARQLYSQKAAYYKEADLQAQRVLVVVNLPKAKLAGTESFGMVLCASAGEAKEQVEFLVPPAEAAAGDRVTTEALQGPPLSSSQVKKKRVWEKVQPKLAVNDGIATWDGAPLVTAAGGTCKPATIQAGTIS